VIGTSVVAGKKIGPYLDRLTELLKTDLNLKLGPCVRTEGVFLTDMPLKRNYFFGKDRVLMVGEATGIVDCNWVGIGCAVDTGMLAGKAISESIERQKDAVSVYRDMLSLVVRGSEASWAGQKVIKLS
jgi:flavin-dependent dehydrogenase